MAVNRVQGTAATAGTGSSIATAYGSNVTAGSLLICAIRGGTAAATFSVTDNNANTWHEIPSSPQADGGTDDVDLWYAANANAGATTVTVTITQIGTHTTRYVIEEYSGVATVSPLDQKNTSGSPSGSNMSVSTGGTLAQANELALTTMETGTAGTNTLPTGYTAGTSDAAAPNTRIQTAWRQAGSAGSTEAVTWQFSAGTVAAAIIATFLPAAGSSFTWQQLVENQVPAEFLSPWEVNAY